MSSVILETQDLVHLRFLDPLTIKVFRHGNAELRMTLADDRTYLRITAARAFPLSDPDHNIGIFDQAGPEIGLIRDLRELDQQSRALIKDELRKRYFTPMITAIHDIKTEFGCDYWKVETDKGPRQFIVRKINKSIFEISPNRYLINDVYGNRFEIRDVLALDKRSRTRLERLL